MPLLGRLWRARWRRFMIKIIIIIIIIIIIM